MSEITTKRHSMSHILAQAVQRIKDPSVKLGIGPDIENGFYYDFIFSENVSISDEDLKEIQKMMEKITKENQEFIEFKIDIEAAQEILGNILVQEYKVELKNDLLKSGEGLVSFYLNTIVAAGKDNILKGINPEYISKYEAITQYFQEMIPELEGKFVTFVDMCAGPHVENSKDIEPGTFKLEKLAGAYWKGDSNNIMMTRIYGYGFDTKDELKSFLEMMEEAKKRDHRILGQKMKIFTISKLVGAGLPLLQPNGMIIRKSVEDYLWELHKNKGYQRVWTPHLAKEDLYKTSGHAEKFGDELFRVKGGDDNFFLKPMNCPHHMQIFADNQFSYRDMPIRYFEPATVYRDEKTGQLSGLTRVRAITQDDGHLFCRVNQISDEVGTIVDIIKQFYTTMGMIDGYWVRLSVRGLEGKYLGSDEVWENAEGSLKTAAEKYQLPYKIGIGEAAFYGPKLDFMFKDAIGREWQLATIQCDFNLPERFDLSFVNESGEKERPVVIHRAISGSLERFMGVMIEHFGGSFPLWLAPKQIAIVPVVDKFYDKCFEIASEMKKYDLRVSIDITEDSFSKKIRNAELDKIPFILIIGEKEIENGTLSIREYKTKAQYEISVNEFIEKCKKQVEERSL